MGWGQDWCDIVDEKRKARFLTGQITERHRNSAVGRIIRKNFRTPGDSTKIRPFWKSEKRGTSGKKKWVRGDLGGEGLGTTITAKWEVGQTRSDIRF